MGQGQTAALVAHAPEVGERATRIVRVRDEQIEAEGVGKGARGMTGMLAAPRALQVAHCRVPRPRSRLGPDRRCGS